MHTIWCVLLLELLFIKIIEGLDYADFGLPNSNPCIFTLNRTVHIINEQSLSIKFDQASWDTITPQIIEHNLTAVASCPITRSGKLILIPLQQQQQQQQQGQQQQQQQQQPFEVIDDITSNSWAINNNITYLGPQNAIDTFMTRTTHFSTTSFNDFIMIFGGNESSTFILDTRYPTLFTWYQIPLQLTTPPSSPDSVLYATSRWVLHFRIEINIAYIDLFDPIGFQWYGTISSIELLNTTTKKNIQVLPLINNNTSDSLLIINVMQDTFSSSDQTRTTTEFWRLDISTWIPDTLTLTKLNTLIRQSSTISTGDGYVIVTPVNDEIALFYGGNEQLAFLDTTNLTFISPPQWITTINNTSLISQNNNLAIILGSVLGGLFFIVLIILFIRFYKRKRSSVPLRPNNNNNNNNNNEKPSSLQKNKWPLLSKRPEKENMITTRAFEESPPLSEFTLSPIKRLSPIELFHPSAAALSTLPDAPENNIDVLSQQQQQNIKGSRFQEHFDFRNFPQDTTITPSKPLPLASSSTTVANQPQPDIPRSSSYV